jgi:hypothetical protein
MSRILAVATTTLLLAGPALAAEPTQEAQIKRAISAGPASVGAKATVMEWESRKVLRGGSNAYTCFPSTPFGGSPMCVDEPWLRWCEALLKRENPPAVEKIAIGYWLQGVPPGSNERPFASAEGMAHHTKADGGPHAAILVPDGVWLESLPTDPTQGGPWVMFKNTPYAHVMVPAPRP